MKWALILILNLAYSLPASAFTPEDAHTLLEINEKMPVKKIMQNNDLCNFHNELVEKAKPKFNHDSVVCNQRKIPSDNEAGDNQLRDQLNSLTQVQGIMELRHPNALSDKQVADEAVRKMTKDYGF